MTSLTYHVAISTDGFIADPQGGFDAFTHDTEVVDDFLSSIREYDAVVMGRKTYDVGLSQGVTNPYPWLSTYVFSRSLERSPDPAVTLVSTAASAASVVSELKQKHERLWLCGGADLAGQLLGAGLIDRLLLKVNPFLLGQGIPLFQSPTEPRQLELQSRHEYGCGVSLVEYRVN